MVVEDIPDWARDENDPPRRMWERKDTGEEGSADSGETAEVIEDDKDHGTGPFFRGLYNVTEETDDEEESEDDAGNDAGNDAEDEDMGEPIDEDEDGEDGEDGKDDAEDDEDGEAEADPDDDPPPSSDTATLDTLAPVGEGGTAMIPTPLNSEKGTDTPTEAQKPRKGRSRMSFKDWLNGTPENPLPLMSIRAKFKRWRLIHFHNHVWLRIMSYDKNQGEYRIYENLIPKSKLPKTAVHCTNEKKVWFDKLFDIPYEPWKDNGFGAMNAYLYMKDTSIDEALLLLWQGPKLSMRTLAIVGVIAVAAIFYIFYMMQG